MTKWFRVSFEVPEDRLETFVALVRGEIRDLKIEQCSGKISFVEKQREYHGRKFWLPKVDYLERPNAKAIHDLAKLGKPFGLAQVENLFKLKKLNPESASPVVSRLLQMGVIERTNVGCRPAQYIILRGKEDDTNSH